MKESATTSQLGDGFLNSLTSTAQYCDHDVYSGAQSTAHSANLNFEYTAPVIDPPSSKVTEQEKVNDLTNHPDYILQTESSIKFFYTNCDTLTNKKEELYTTISLVKPDVIALTEIYPKRINQDYAIQPTELQLQGYHMFLPAKLKVRQRGVVVYLKKGISGSLVDIDEGKFEETVWI